jgi:hypothetical protein
MWYTCPNYSEIVIVHGLEARTVKSKAIPLQAWTVPEDSRRMRLSYFKTIGT